jgi:type IV secretion system protein VirB3
MVRCVCDSVVHRLGVMSHVDPLYVACTRPAMKWGVPFEGFVANAVGTALFAVVIIGSPPGFLVGFLVHFALRELCRIDPHFFHKWKLFFNTKMRSRTGALWGGSRLQPSIVNLRKAQDVDSCV